MSGLDGLLTVHMAAVSGLLLEPRPDLGTIVVTGKDRVTWLNGLVTCDLAKAKLLDGLLGLAVGKTGKILAELWILLAKDRLVVGLAAEKVGAMLEHFDKHLIMEDAAVADASAATRWLALVGPRRDDGLLRALNAGAAQAALDWTGRGHAGVVACAADVEAALTAELVASGAVIAEPEDAAALHVAMSLPRFGVDFTDENLPHEASLEQLAVSFSKGCYLGQEAVFMLEARGHAKKHLARLTIEGDAAVSRGAEVTLADGSVVGEVTSSTITPDGVAALAFVKHKHAEPGAALLVDGRAATLVALAARVRK